MDTPIATSSLVLGRILSRQARYRPGHLAVVFENERLTYAEFNALVNRWANALSGLGVVRGDRVATIQRVHCGRCDLCRRGRTTLCKEGVFFGEEIPGGYAEYVVSEEQGLARVPHGIALEEASICACTIGTAIHVARTRGGVQLDETVLITGASGGVGLHAIQICRLIGARVLAVTSSPQKDLTRAAV